MPGQTIQLIAFTRADRNQMTDYAKDAINSSGGWILDFKFFSNISIRFNFEIPKQSVEKLQSALAEIDLQLSDESTQTLAEIINQEFPSNASTKDLKGTLHITFVHDEPDLHLPVPPIPG
jgi:hypothetical protein